MNTPPYYKIRQYIPQDIQIQLMSSNSSIGAMNILVTNPENIDWYSLSFNTNYITRFLYRNNTDRMSAIDPSVLFENPCMKYLVIETVHTYKDLRLWYNIASNDACGDFIEENIYVMFALEHLEYPVWSKLSGNKGFSKYLKLYIEKIDWDVLSQNTSNYALDLLEQYRWLINWSNLCANTNPRAIELLKHIHISLIDWTNLCYNTHPYAISLIEDNMDKVDWFVLSMNPSAVHILISNMDKIHWDAFSANPSQHAVDILRQNMSKIDYMWFFKENPNIGDILYKYDYDYMDTSREYLHHELIQFFYNPKRLMKLCRRYCVSLEEIQDMF